MTTDALSPEGEDAAREIPEDIALALSDLQRASQGVGEAGWGPDRHRMEREEREARGAALARAAQAVVDCEGGHSKRGLPDYVALIPCDKIEALRAALRPATPQTQEGRETR